MNLDVISQRAGIRFDPGLGILNELLSFYLEEKRTPAKIVAQGPLCPSEVVFASGAVPYDLVTRSALKAIFNAKASVSQEAIDAQMSPEFSSWNLVMLGSIISGQCDAQIDLFSTAVGGFDEQLIKSFHLMAEACDKPCYFWEVPAHDAESEARAIRYLERELAQLSGWLSAYSGQKVTEKSLAKAIHEGNNLRRDMYKLDACLAVEKVPLKGLEYYLVQVMLGDCAQDPVGLHRLFQELERELKDKAQSENTLSMNTKPVRIYFLGDETQELGVFNAIEEHGGVLVGSSARLPLYYDLIDEHDKPLHALAKWIWNMPNNLPAQARVKFQLEYVKRQHPDAVIINSTVGSRFFPGFERMSKDIIKRELGIPVLCIETSFPGENIDKVDYQVSALIQTLTASF